MCERTCPKCQSTEHVESYGICGAYLLCTCGTILAHRADPAAAPTDHPDPDRWAQERIWVLLGAEAINPSDDKMWKRGE